MKRGKRIPESWKRSYARTLGLLVEIKKAEAQVIRALTGLDSDPVMAYFNFIMELREEINKADKLTAFKCRGCDNIAWVQREPLHHNEDKKNCQCGEIMDRIDTFTLKKRKEDK